MLRRMVIHLIHAGVSCPADVILPTIANHQGLLQLGLRGRKGEVENLHAGLQDADVLGQHHLAEVAIDACRAHLAMLQLAEAVGEDKEAVFPGEMFQHFTGVGHQFLSGGYHFEKVVGKGLRQPRIFHPRLLQGVEEALAVQFVLRDEASSVFFPQLEVAARIEAVEVFE